MSDVKVTIKDLSESDESFSVYTTLEGDKGSCSFRHSFPKRERYFEEDEEGEPKFVKDLRSLYDKKMSSKVDDLGDTSKVNDDYKGAY